MKWALVLSATVVSAACTPLDIVVADPHGCAATADCHGDEFCEKENCGADAGTGHCVPQPRDCSRELHMPGKEVCGCNGVVYWNDCLRRASGESRVAGAGECANPATCTEPSTCPDPSASCALQAATSCGAPVTGTCWVLPRNCPPTMPDQALWRSCGGPVTCRDICHAIQSNEQHQFVSVCP